MAGRYITRPLSDRSWLRPVSQRVQTRFSAKWSATLELLYREVDFLDGRNLVIEVDVQESDLRLDGTIRARARAASPAVIVSFESKHGPLSYRCDRFYAAYSWQVESWQQNVRAVALTLEALRSVDRYGATETGQQYAGWKAIGSAPAAAVQTPLEVMEELAGITLREAWLHRAAHQPRPSEGAPGPRGHLRDLGPVHRGVPTAGPLGQRPGVPMKRHTSTCDECGWTSNACDSEGRAAYALRRHSCEKQRATRAARERRLAREAAVDRTPKPCLHKKTRHVHGTHACYVLDACRCPDCTAGNRAYEQQRARQHAYGRWNGYVDATPAREHVERLQAQGMGWKRIARAADLPESTVWKLLYGDPSRNQQPCKRIRPATADALLGVQLDLAPHALVDGTGTARRVQALVALGWSMAKIAARLGIQRSNFTPIAHGTGKVTVSTATAVRDLYDELWDVEPPRVSHRDKIAYSRARNLARTLGWVPPLAWDEDAIDDPAATPVAAEQHRPGGKRVYVEDLEWLLEDEPLATAQRLADRLGVSRDAIQQAARRDERHDLVARLARNAELRKEHVA